MLQGCWHPLAIIGKGDIVERLDGVRGCTYDEYIAADPRCTENSIDQSGYTVSYEAVPHEGWAFVGWQGTPCSSLSTSPYCDFDLPKDFIDLVNEAWPGTEVPPTTALFQKQDPQWLIAGFEDSGPGELGIFLATDGGDLIHALGDYSGDDIQEAGNFISYSRTDSGGQLTAYVSDVGLPTLVTIAGDGRIDMRFHNYRLDEGLVDVTMNYGAKEETIQNIPLPTDIPIPAEQLILGASNLRNQAAPNVEGTDFFDFTDEAKKVEYGVLGLRYAGCLAYAAAAGLATGPGVVAVGAVAVVTCTLAVDGIVTYARTGELNTNVIELSNCIGSPVNPGLGLRSCLQLAGVAGAKWLRILDDELNDFTRDINESVSLTSEFVRRFQSFMCEVDSDLRYQAYHASETASEFDTPPNIQIISPSPSKQLFAGEALISALIMDDLRVNAATWRISKVSDAAENPFERNGTLNSADDCASNWADTVDLQSYPAGIYQLLVTAFDDSERGMSRSEHLFEILGNGASFTVYEIGGYNCAELGITCGRGADNYFRLVRPPEMLEKIQERSGQDSNGSPIDKTTILTTFVATSTPGQRVCRGPNGQWIPRVDGPHVREWDSPIRDNQEGEDRHSTMSAFSVQADGTVFYEFTSRWNQDLTSRFSSFGVSATGRRSRDYVSSESLQLNLDNGGGRWTVNAQNNTRQSNSYGGPAEKKRSPVHDNWSNYSRTSTRADHVLNATDQGFKEYSRLTVVQEVFEGEPIPEVCQ
jgi:hypothetical protein